MRRSYGIVLQGCSARPFALYGIASPSSVYLSRTAQSHLHTASTSSHPSSTQSVRSNHNLNSANTSSSTSENQPPPLASFSKKRANGNKPSIPIQPRSALPKENPATASAVGQNKQSKTASLSTREPSSAAAEAISRAKAAVNTTAARSPTSASTSTQTSTSEEQKKPEPPKTLLDRIKGLWENLKYLFKFYYEGVKQIWRDRGIVADLRKQITDRETKTGEGVRWIENAVIKQHEADLKKLPLFLAILLILEEVLPLVVIYAPSLLPSTCVLPSQSTKMRSGEERLRGLAVQALSKDEEVRKAVTQNAVAAETKPSSSGGSDEKQRSTVPPLATPLDPAVIPQVAQLFALSARGPTSMIQSRIQRHLQKIQIDDKLLQRAFQSKGSTPEWKQICSSDWLWKACAQRGLRSFEAEAKVMEQNLVAYLHLTTCQNLDDTHRSLLPLALYDGSLQDLMRYQHEAEEESSKGIRRRTMEVVQEVKETEKRKEETH